MMKLYVSPGACSMSCHIVAEESGLPFEPILCDWDNAELRVQIEKLNPQGAVPILVLEDGTVITQNIAIHTHIADRAVEKGLLPRFGTLERTQAYQWLSWIAADLHKAFGPLFNPALPADGRNAQIEQIHGLLAEVDNHLGGKQFLAGNQFTAADAYLFVVFSWASYLKVPVDRFKNVQAHSARVFERPAVKTVLKREGIAG